MDIRIAVTGRPCSGKTSLVSCMFRAMDNVMPGYFGLPSAEDFDVLTKAYKNLEAKISGSSQGFTAPLTSEEVTGHEYSMIMKSKGEDVRFIFQENPRDISGTKIFIAVIDAPLLMNGKNDESGVTLSQEVFRKSLEVSEGSKLLLIVPLKCELYTKRDRAALLAKISETFGEISELSRTKYRRRSAIATIPVLTMGGASFEAFSREDGKITGERFKRDRSVNFRPECADQVMRFLLGFMIHDDDFSGDTLKTALDIAGGAGLDDERYSILSGHELLEPVRPKKPNYTLGIAAAVLAVIILAAGGYYVYSRQGRKAQEVIAENTRQNEEAIAELQARAEEEITEARNSEQAAMNERIRAVDELNTLRRGKEQAEKRAERAENLAKRYRQENEALRQQIEQLNAELESARQPKKERRKFLGIF